MTNYTEIDLTAAREGDEMHHAGEWVPVASVAIHKGTARVAWQVGGSHTFPVRHGAKFRRAVVAAEPTAADRQARSNILRRAVVAARPTAAAISDTNHFPRIPDRLAIVANLLYSEGYEMEPEQTGGVWVLVGYKADDTNVVVSEDSACVYAAGDWQRPGAEPVLTEPTAQPDQAEYNAAVIAAVRELA